MSSNQYLIDASSRHAVFLQRYSAGLERDISDMIAESLSAVVSSLSVDDIELMSSSRFGSLQAEILSAFDENLDDLSERLTAELHELLADEADFSIELFERAVSVGISPSSPQQLGLALDLSPMDVAPGVQMTIRQALNDFGQKKTQQVKQLLDDGFIQGKTSVELIRDVRGIVPLQKRQVAALVRTGTNATSTIARKKTMDENRDIFEGYEWVSTLDNKTSNICKARDGVIYEFKDSNPKPPAHWSCRSTIIPKVKPEYDLFSNVTGVRPSVGAGGARQVGAKTTYGGWLRGQPVSFQNEVLGVARAKLFRNGGLTVDKFVDDSGRTYTLAELRALNPLAFEKANL